MSTENQANAENSSGIIKIRSMHKWYGQFHVLKDINLTVAPQEKIVICGPSGSGKSTLIRCINRLEEHQQGSIEVDGRRAAVHCFEHCSDPLLFLLRDARREEAVQLVTGLRGPAASPARLLATEPNRCCGQRSSNTTAL